MPDDRTNNFLVKPIFGHQKFSSNHSLILDLELLEVSFFFFTSTKTMGKIDVMLLILVGLVLACFLSTVHFFSHVVTNPNW